MVKGYRHLSVLSTNSAASMLLLATLPVVIWLGLKLTRRLSQQADHQETSTMSADTTSSLFPDRPIRPLPKRRLRERLSPQVADSIQYPPAPQALTPLFSYPYTLRDEKEDPGFGSRSRGSELDPRQSRRTGLTTEEEEEDPTTVRGQTGRDASRSSARLGQHRIKSDSGRNGNGSIQQPLSSASSLDGYDAFENTNNKKKRKIPTAGDSALNGVHVISDSVASVAGLSTAEHSMEGNRDALETPLPSSYGSNSSWSGGQNIAGPGRGRYGRSRSARGPLRPLPDLANIRNGMPQPVSWTPRKLTTLSKCITQDRRDRVANNAGTGKRNGIIAEAIAETKKQVVSQGQENISLLQDYLSKKRDPASAQFTFTCDSQVPGSLAWPGSDRRPSSTAPAHQAPSARQGGDTWSRNPQSSQNDAPAVAPLDAEAASKEASSQNSVVGQDPVAAQKAARRSLAREYDAAAKARRRETLLYNKRHPPKSEEVWICHFCEYESIFGRPPSALIRLYEVRDRKQRLSEQQRKAQWERLRKGKHKGKKNSKLAAKSNDTTHDTQQTTAAQGAAANSPAGQGSQSDDYFNVSEFEDDEYEPDEDIPPDGALDVSDDPQNGIPQSGHHPPVPDGGGT